MKNACQKVLYLLKLFSTKFDLESNWKFLDEKRRPKILVSSQTLLNEIRFRINLKVSEWKMQAKNSYISNSSQRSSIYNQIETFWKKNTGQKFPYLLKLSSAKFDLESNWKFLKKIAGQIFLYLLKLFSTKFELESIGIFWMKNAGQKFLYLLKLSSTKFDLESNWKFLNKNRWPNIPMSSQTFLNEIRFRINWNFLNKKCRPKIPISSQTLLNEIRFRIKLKVFE